MSEPQEQVASTDPVSATVTFDDETRNHFGSADSALSIAQCFEITCHDDCQEAVNERNANLKEIEWLEKRLEYVLAPFTEGVKRVRALFAPRLERRKAAVAYLNPLIIAWTLKEENRIKDENAKREAEERRVRQEAEQKVAAENARAQAEADEQRRQAEAQEKIRQKAIADGDAKAAEDAAKSAAELLQKAGHTIETAEANTRQIVMEAAATASAPAAVAPVIEGNQLRGKWVPELQPTFTEEQAMLAIINAIANGQTLADGNKTAPRHDLLGIMKIDFPAFNKLAASLKANMMVPGYLAKNKPIAAGSKK